ncbi:MAG: Mfa1 family fimbria major subunit [Muribaculaceae bacterium]|nr:Mfa1 family fimbria major subunit [Muribaculaceae bacterium]
MKFSKYFMMAGAAALFASCSSEDPDHNGNYTVEEEGPYIAINVIGAETRAGAVERDGESKINQLQIFVLDDLENLYFTKTVEAKNITNGLAKFAVTNATWYDMQAKLERGAKMNIIVYANGKDVLTTSDQILHGTTNIQTWGIATDNNGYNSKGFVMSNAKEVLQEFKAPGEDVDGSAAHPWVISEPIELSRLSTRFEWGEANKDSYTALHESGVTMTIAGFDVETYAKSTYRIAQFSADGSRPDAFDKTNHTHYAPTDAFPYRMTDSFGGSDAMTKYENYDYTITPTNKYLYKRPNTVSQNFVFKHDASDYAKVPCAVVKAEFTCTNFSGTGAPSASMAAGDEIYAIDGIFIGGFKDFKALRAKAGATFKVNYTEKSGEKNNFNTAEKANIKLIEDNYNRLLKMSLPSEYDKNKTEADDMKWFKTNLGEKVDVYEADENKKYYTYYAALIINDAANTDLYWKYGVSRNTAYALTVNSFKYLGNSGDGFPGEGPTPADLSDMNLTLTVKVNAWTLNLDNNWDL